MPPILPFLRKYRLVVALVIADLVLTVALMLSGFSLSGVVWISAVAGVLVGMAVAAASRDA